MIIKAPSLGLLFFRSMARICIDVKKIEQNSRLVAELVQPYGVSLVGVTKACLGDPLVGQAMLDGGAAALADSRGENLVRLRQRLPGARLQLMRPSVVNIITESRGEPDLYFVSSAEQAKLLLAAGSQEAVNLCLMVETGDGREGAPPKLAAEEAAKIGEMPGVELAGLATNAACSRQPASLEDTLSLFYEVSSSLPPFPIKSAGGSGLLALILNDDALREAGCGNAVGGGGATLTGITELRCGEAILLGRIPAGRGEDIFLPGAHRDAFVIEGRVLEIYQKEGRRQALVDFGLQDVGTAPLKCSLAGIEPRLATSDYLAVSCAEEAGPLRVGGSLSFIPSYYALVAAMTSPFVEKVYL